MVKIWRRCALKVCETLSEIYLQHNVTEPSITVTEVDSNCSLTGGIKFSNSSFINDPESRLLAAAAAA